MRAEELALQGGESMSTNALDLRFKSRSSEGLVESPFEKFSLPKRAE